MTNDKKMMKNKNNTQFCLLSLLGILFVVDGHLSGGLFDLNGLLPYYSFHMPLFVFISGYFYQSGSEQDIPGYIKKKFMRLMVPYFIWNLFYGILAQVFRQYGFSFGEPVTLETLFVEPFRHGYQFILNHAAWFVPTLFLVQVANICLMRILCVFHVGKRAEKNGQSIGADGDMEGRSFVSGVKSAQWLVYMRTVLYFLIGLAGIYTAMEVSTAGFWLTFVKAAFLLPFYGAGILYRERLEARDRIGSGWYFSVILSIALLLALSGRRLVYAVSDCSDFTGYVLPYLTGFLGIAFWLRVCRILAPSFAESRLAAFVGRNTYAVMMHHMMVLFVIRTGYAFFAKYFGMFPDFSFVSYKNDFYYTYIPEGLPQLRILYLILAVAVPLCLEAGIYRGKRILKDRIRIHK